MLWKAMQLAIVIAVIGSNNANHWAPTGLSAGIVAVLAAFVVTGVISELLRLCCWLLVVLKRFNEKKVTRELVARQRAGHQLIGEIGLDGRRHDGSTSQGLGNAEQARIEKMKGVGPLRRP